MRLQIGLLGTSIPWQEILAQEGVSWVQVNDPVLYDACSAVVIAKPLDATERAEIAAYLKKGGGILSFAGYINGVAGTTTRQERIDYIVAHHDTLFPSVHLMDLGVIGEVPKEANCLRTQQLTHAVFAGMLGGGCAVLLPFDPAAVVADIRSAHKRFYAPWERLPSERVSAVSKGEVVRLVHDALTYLHSERGLPYVHAWYFPFGERSLFAFRVDTDKGSKAEVDELSHLALSKNIRMSLFADVKSHEQWLQHFAYLSGHEVGVHCYEHRTFETYKENLENITVAKKKLNQVGVSAAGFSAPFGMWNIGLARAIDEIDFEYSSEFSYAYDALPLFPVSAEKRYNTLQIPIHPVCIGSMLQVGYSAARMKEYFRRTIALKVRRNEPLFFYHHPSHHGWEVLETVFEIINEKKIENMTFIEFAHWWKKRLGTRFDAEFRDSRLFLKSITRDLSVWYRVIAPDGRELLLEGDCDAVPSELAFLPHRAPATPPDDIFRVREFDPRRELADLFTTITRKLSEHKTAR